jgi:hypothetical protein
MNFFSFSFGRQKPLCSTPSGAVKHTVTANANHCLVDGFNLVYLTTKMCLVVDVLRFNLIWLIDINPLTVDNFFSTYIVKYEYIWREKDFSK